MHKTSSGHHASCGRRCLASLLHFSLSPEQHKNFPQEETCCPGLLVILPSLPNSKDTCTWNSVPSPQRVLAFSVCSTHLGATSTWGVWVPSIVFSEISRVPISTERVCVRPHHWFPCQQRLLRMWELAPAWNSAVGVYLLYVGRAGFSTRHPKDDRKQANNCSHFSTSSCWRGHLGYIYLFAFRWTFLQNRGIRCFKMNTRSWVLEQRPRKGEMCLWSLDKGERAAVEGSGLVSKGVFERVFFICKSWNTHVNLL